MEEQSLNNKNEKQTPLERLKIMEEAFKKHGIPFKNRTAERLGQTSIMFVNSPSAEAIDEAETALHYHNQRKGH